MKIARVHRAIGRRIFSKSRFSKSRFMKYRTTREDLMAAIARTIKMPTPPKLKLADVTVIAVRTTRPTHTKM
jgi:hypothetical protein